MTTISLIDQNTLANYNDFLGAVQQSIVDSYVQAMTTPTYPTVEDNSKIKEMGGRLVVEQESYARKIARIAISLTSIDDAITFTITDGVVTAFTIEEEVDFKLSIEDIWLALYTVV